MTELPEPRVELEGRYLRFVRRGRWEYVERTNATGIVVIVPVTDDGRLVLVEQLRVPVAARVIELPAGLVGDTDAARGEDLADAAKRELVEETGYEADRLEPILTGPISAGLSTELITVFMARGVRHVGPGGGDGTEDIVVHAVALDKADSWLREAAARGFLIDAKVYAGLYFARA